MILTIPFEFAYEMRVKRHRQRKGEVLRFRASENLHFESLCASDTEVAYRIENTKDAGGPANFEVRRYRDRLWWPWDGYGSNGYGSSSLNGWPTLKAFSSSIGKLLGVEQLYDVIKAAPAADQQPWRIVESTWEAKFTVYQRKAANLIVIDGRVYAVGGVPFLVSYDGRISLASTGKTRSVDPQNSELRFQPCGHPDMTDWPVCGGKFWTPNSPGLRREAARLRCRVPRIDAERPVEVDFLDVRADAAFRMTRNEIIRSSWKHSYARTQRETWSLYEEASNPRLPDLTGLRLHALLRFLEAQGEKLMAQSEMWPAKTIRSMKRFIHAEAEKRKITTGSSGELAPEDESALDAIAASDMLRSAS